MPTVQQCIKMDSNFRTINGFGMCANFACSKTCSRCSQCSIIIDKKIQSNMEILNSICGFACPL